MRLLTLHPCCGRRAGRGGQAAWTWCLCACRSASAALVMLPVALLVVPQRRWRRCRLPVVLQAAGEGLHQALAPWRQAAAGQTRARALQAAAVSSVQWGFHPAQPRAQAPGRRQRSFRLGPPAALLPCRGHLRQACGMAARRRRLPLAAGRLQVQPLVVRAVAPVRLQALHQMRSHPARALAAARAASRHLQVVAAAVVRRCRLLQRRLRHLLRPNHRRMLRRHWSPLMRWSMQ